MSVIYAVDAGRDLRCGESLLPANSLIGTIAFEEDWPREVWLQHFEDGSLSDTVVDNVHIFKANREIAIDNSVIQADATVCAVTIEDPLDGEAVPTMVYLFQVTRNGAATITKTGP